MTQVAGSGAGALTVPARTLRSRLRAGARSRPRPRLSDIYFWVLLVVVVGAIAAEMLRPLVRLLTGPGWAVHGAPGRLFAMAAVVLLLGRMAQLLGAAGPVTASPAVRFWLLAAPVRRRDLLRRRFLWLLAATAAIACVVVIPVAHAASVAVLPVVAAAVLAAVTVAAVAVWGQASEAAERAVHVAGKSLSALSLLGFSSLATGAGRASANSALHAPTVAVAVLVGLLALSALACSWCAYHALDRIDVSVLSRGQGLWTAGQAAAASLDGFLLADFLAEQRTRSVGRVRSARIGPGFAAALSRAEWARLRRRPGLALRALAAAVVWWGCRPVLPGPALAALAVIIGYFLVLPLPGTLKQLASSAGLRAQFAPRDKWLSRASVGVCLLGAAAWTAIVVPGLAVPAIGVVIVAGITGAACRTVTRPPLDYSKPPIPTPFGDIPLDLWRQLARGLLLLAVVVFVVVRY